MQTPTPAFNQDLHLWIQKQQHTNILFQYVIIYLNITFPVSEAINGMKTTEVWKLKILIFLTKFTK
jgi:hypothetical protein